MISVRDYGGLGRRLSETRLEKLKSEAGMAESGTGYGSWGRAASPHTRNGSGVSSPSGVQGKAPKMWFWYISGIEKSSTLEISQ